MSNSTLSKAKQIAVIQSCFRKIPTIQSGWNELDRNLFNMCLASEKQHRHNSPVKGFSENDAAKYFTVKHLIDAVEKPELFKVTDLLRVRYECMYAQAIVGMHAAELAEFKTFVDASDFAQVDYVQLMG